MESRLFTAGMLTGLVCGASICAFSVYLGFRFINPDIHKRGSRTSRSKEETPIS